MRSARKSRLFFELSELFHSLGVKLEADSIRQTQDLPVGIWFRVELFSRSQALIGLDPKSFFPTRSITSRLKRFLSLFESEQSTSITIQDFGYWTPPRGFVCHAVEIPEWNVRFYVALTELSNWDSRTCEARLYRDEIDEISLQCMVHMNVDEFPGMTTHSRGVLELLGLRERKNRSVKIAVENGVYVMTIESEEEGVPQEGSRRECQIPGTVQLYGIEIPFEDYLLLEPGDEIELGEVSELRAHYSVGGVALLDGTLRSKEGRLTFIPHKRGNNLRQFSIDLVEGTSS